MSDERELERDEALGAALRSLPAPEHRPGFHEDIRALLADQAAAARPALPPPDGFRRRGPGRHRASRRRPWAAGLAATAAAVAVAVMVVTGTLPGTRERVATAAEVRAAVSRAWASARTLGGVLVVESVDPGAFGRGEVRWSFLITDRGDFRLTGMTRSEDLAYDAGRNVERSYFVDEETGDAFGGVRTGVAPGWPDQGPSTAILQGSLGAVVRALASTGGGSVREGTYTGRPVWILDTDIRVSQLTPDLSADHLQVWVDRETGFPLRARYTRDGELHHEVRIEGLRVNEPVGEDAFAIEFPPGAEVHRTDAGFRRVSLREAAEIVGYDPLVPAWVPGGYELAEAAVSTEPSFTGTEGGNPPVGNIVSLSYRRGLDQFLVTTRPVGDDPSLWADPLGTGEGFIDRPDEVTFSGGALDGRPGELMIDPLAVPHVWGMTDELVVTVSGDLTRAELLEVAGSLG